MTSQPIDRRAILTSDYFRLRALQKKSPNAFATAYEKAKAAFALRAQSRPTIAYAENLPVSLRADEIAALIAKHQVLVLTGETGSGKTTQLPKICIAAGRATFGFIGHTQPRRLAARSVAQRIAAELNEPMGKSIGYKVRFGDTTTDSAYVKLMTDGILLAETQSDKFLNAYDTIIIDEAHERSLNIDFLLGYLKQLLPKRPDLKLIITSATIDAQRFVEHFTVAGVAPPLIEVSGRTFPVEIRYRPVNDAHDDDEQEIEDAIADAVDECAMHGPGDVLVFLPGEREIRETADILRRRFLKAGKRVPMEILPLFARLSNEEQQAIFQPTSAVRRVILSTNVAETSLTVPGIRFVIDAGLARIKRYAPRSKIELLHIENVSQASANQRAGRCGRVGPGVCIRLFSEQDFATRPAFTEPEILRSSLAAVILQLSALGFGRIEEFPFIESPSGRAIADGYAELQDLGALDGQSVLTHVGRELARMPLEPRLGRMLIEAKARGCINEVLVIVAGLSVQDPRERPMDVRELADRAHAKWHDERSDFVAMLNVWRWFANLTGEGDEEKRSHRTQVQLCRDNFVNWLRLREWRDIARQLRDVLEDLAWKLPSSRDIVLFTNDKNDAVAYESLHRALLAGLATNVGTKDAESDQYLGPRGLQFVPFPGSGVNKKSLRWLLAAELSETTRLYARTIARVEPEWIELAAGDRVSRHLFEPSWDAKMAQVVAYERIALHGLTLVARRRVSAERLDGSLATEIFIREALVVGSDFGKSIPFLQANRALVKEVEALEHRARRQDVLVDDETLVTFYKRRLPAGIASGAAFESWLKTQPNDRALRFDKVDLIRANASAPTEAQFPKNLKVGEVSLALQYRFEIGNVLDGVTVRVPLSLLNKLTQAQVSWLVPGLIREKIAAMFKLLPKAARGRVQPIPDAVTHMLECVNAGEAPLQDAARTFLREFYDLRVEAAEWNCAELPAHLQMNIRVMDDQGGELAMGRDLTALQSQLGQAAQVAFSGAQSALEKTGLKSWDGIGTLPETISIKRGTQTVVAFPALVDEGASVGLTARDTAFSANGSHRAGVLRLMRIELAAQIRQWEKGPSGFAQIALQLKAIAPSEALLKDYLDAVCDRALLGDDPVPRDEKSYKAQLARGKTRLPAVAQGLAQTLLQIANENATLNQALTSSNGAARALVTTLKAWRESLLYPGFMSATPWSQLTHFPRYVEALHRRLGKFRDYPLREQRHGPQIAQYQQRWRDAIAGVRVGEPTPEKLIEIRWITEELHVSLFAQELKTPYPVSMKRLDKLWLDAT